MPINITINGAAQAVPRRFLVGVLTAQGREAVYAKRTFAQWFADLFGTAYNKNTIDALYDQLTQSGNPSDFQFNVITLLQSIPNETDRARFSGALRFKPTEEATTLYLLNTEGGYSGEISFDQRFSNPWLFNYDHYHDENVYRLREKYCGLTRLEFTALEEKLNALEYSAALPDIKVISH